MGTIKKGKIVFDNAKGLVGAVPQGFEMEMEDDKIHYNKETDTTEVEGNFEVEGNVRIDSAESITDKEGNPIINQNYPVIPFSLMVDTEGGQRATTSAEDDFFNQLILHKPLALRTPNEEEKYSFILGLVFISANDEYVTCKYGGLAAFNGISIEFDYSVSNKLVNIKEEEI